MAEGDGPGGLHLDRVQIRAWRDPAARPGAGGWGFFCKAVFPSPRQQGMEGFDSVGVKGISALWRERRFAGWTVHDEKAAGRRMGSA